MYGKYISCIPPKKCIITAPGADSLLEPFPNIQYANNTPSPGPGLASRSEERRVGKEC